MKTYEFNVVLKDTTEVTDDQADAFSLPSTLLVQVSLFI